MLQYITRRILLIIPTIVGVSLVLLFIFAMAPGDAITANMDPNMSVETKQAIREIIENLISKVKILTQ